jgi:hypothetical protein
VKFPREGGQGRKSFIAVSLLNAPVVTYTRGNDLSGSFEDAGGIGGLLARTDDRAGTTAFYHADRLGNVTMLINAQQVPVAKYLYDPFAPEDPPPGRIPPRGVPPPGR